MPNFSTDADLLKWEPALLREIALDHQCLARGSGATSQTFSVVAEDAAFETAKIRAGHVIHLRNDEQGIDGYYEVFSAESETELLAGLLGGRGDEWVPLPSGTDLAFDLHTFDPQHEEARFALLARFGLETDADDATSDVERWIFQRRTFRRASVAMVLAMLYRGQSAAGPDAAGMARKADHYARMYEDEATKARVVLDRDGDGRPDDVRTLSSHRLHRD
jgi:hypothetical protein